MAFKVAARAVLELGAELISSDDIAIYELVKNAFDAGSEDVSIDFTVLMRRTDYETLAAAFADPIYEDDEGEPREPTAEVRRLRGRLRPGFRSRAAGWRNWGKLRRRPILRSSPTARRPLQH